MYKIKLSIFISLFLVVLLSCSNADKTGTGNSMVDNSKGVEQFNGNIYVSSKITINNQSGYLWVSIKDAKVSLQPDENNMTSPTFNDLSYFSVKGSGTDYSFSIPDSKQNPDSIVGTLKFTSDGSSVTVNFTENGNDPTGETLNKHFVCNKK